MISSKRLLILILSALLSFGCNQSAQEKQDSPPAASTGNAAGASSAKRRIFVSNYRSDTISVLEGDPEVEVKVIQSDESPHGMAIRPTEPRLLAVANSTEDSVSFYDVETLEKKGKVVGVTPGPQHVKFSPDGKTLYVVSPYGQDLSFIDVDAMKEVGEPINFDPKKPRRVIVDPDGSRLFVLVVARGNGDGAEVAVVDSKTHKITKRIPIGRHPHALAYGNNGRLLASASFDDSTLTVIDTKSLEVLATYEAETGFGLAIHPTKPIAYSMSSFDDEFYIYNLDDGKLIKSVTAGQWPTYPAFGAGGRYLYIPHEESDSLVKLDTETNEVVMKTAVGKEPIEVAIYEP